MRRALYSPKTRFDRWEELKLRLQRLWKRKLAPKEERYIELTGPVLPDDEAPPTDAEDKRKPAA